ncbi:MAG: site-specific integrase [Clostridia bacterium]|nr:site-specific integrase [Clostridia bacterium]
MGRRKNGDGSIRQRNDGRWEVSVTVKHDFATGGPKRITRTAHSQEEALALLHEMNYLNDTRPQSFADITLGEWLDMCLDVYMRNALKQSTYNSYESYIRVHLKPALGNLKLQQLSPRLLQEFYNYKSEFDGLAPKTIVNINLFLHKALSFAVGEGILALNPASAINLPRGQKPKIEILSRDEQARLIQGSYRHRYGVFVRLTLFTGLRVGELLGLRWEDIDFTGQMLSVRRTLNRLNKKKRPTEEGVNTTEIVIQSPKSENAVRKIPLLPAVMEDLMNWRATQRTDRISAGETYCDSGMIVTNSLGGYIEPRTFKDYYNQIRQLSGIRHVTFHALRHMFATRVMEQGMDSKTLSVLLGHYSVAFTMDTYTHVLDEHKRDGISLMEDLYTMQPMEMQSYSYPVLISTDECGKMTFTVPDYPLIEFIGTDLQGGIAYIKERLQEEVLTDVCPVMPTPPELIQVNAGQLLIQVPV